MFSLSVEVKLMQLDVVKRISLEEDVMKRMSLGEDVVRRMSLGVLRKNRRDFLYIVY